MTGAHRASPRHPDDVRLGEIVSDVKQGRVAGYGQRVTETVSEVERSTMASSSECSRRVPREGHLFVIDSDDLGTNRLQSAIRRTGDRAIASTSRAADDSLSMTAISTEMSMPMVPLTGHAELIVADQIIGVARIEDRQARHSFLHALHRHPQRLWCAMPRLRCETFL